MFFDTLGAGYHDYWDGLLFIVSIKLQWYNDDAKTSAYPVVPMCQHTVVPVCMLSNA